MRRGLVIARVVVVGVMAGTVGLLSVRLTLQLCHPSRAKVLLTLIDAVADWVSFGTAGLFSIRSHSNVSVAVNAGVAIAIWVAFGAVILRLISTKDGGVVERIRWSPRRASVGADTVGSVPMPVVGRRRVPPISRALFTAVTVLGVLESATLSGTYLLYSRHYVSTDNAKVDGDKIVINAPVTGAVRDWAIDEGSNIRARQVIGRIQSVGGIERPQRTVLAPGNGTVAVNDVVNGAFVTAGTELATAYDLSHIYVTARVGDSDIAAVHPGAPVDIDVDAFPNSTVTGIVEVVQFSAAGNFTIYPPAGTVDPTSPHAIDQYIPVKIAFTYTGGAAVIPGMSVTVHIQKS